MGPFTYEVWKEISQSPGIKNLDIGKLLSDNKVEKPAFIFEMVGNQFVGRSRRIFNYKQKLAFYSIRNWELLRFH